MKTVWALLDSNMGSVGQIRGVTQALDENKYKVIEKKITYTKLATIPNIFKGASLIGVDKETKKHLNIKDLPDLVISGSRRTAPIARWLKKKSKNKIKIVQILHPDCFGLSEFDAIFLPKHDRGKGNKPNFHFITGAPHRVTDKSLKEAHELWCKEFKDLPRPLTAVIVGGKTKDKPFSLENAINLGREIRKFKEKTGGSILITDSKRTGPDAEKIILEEIKRFPAYKYLWGTTGVNPFMGYLACADNVIVTGDSVSMSCESCGTGKPVFIFSGKDWLSKKHYRFIDSLFQGNFAAPLDAKNLDFKPKAKLNAAFEVAKEIDKLFA